MALSQAGRRDPDDHQKSYVCSHVFTTDRDILYVTRPDGDWCFMCGGDDHPDDSRALRMVGLGHVIRCYASVAELLDLEPDEEAERASVAANWVRSRF